MTLTRSSYRFTGAAIDGLHFCFCVYFFHNIQVNIVVLSVLFLFIDWLNTDFAELWFIFTFCRYLLFIFIICGINNVLERIYNFFVQVFVLESLGNLQFLILHLWWIFKTTVVGCCPLLQHCRISPLNVV